jgi:alpha-ketoglutarate-dependent taurine dioxygenase
MSTISTLKTEKLTASVGAEVLDVDSDRLLNDNALPHALMNSLEANGVLVFRGLHIDDETQIALCRKLGELVTYPG